MSNIIVIVVITNLIVIKVKLLIPTPSLLLFQIPHGTTCSDAQAKSPEVRFDFSFPYPTPNPPTRFVCSLPYIYIHTPCMSTSHSLKHHTLVPGTTLHSSPKQMHPWPLQPTHHTSAEVIFTQRNDITLQPYLS